MNKSELLDWLRDEYRLWEELLAQIGPTRMEQSGVNGDWSMKDIVVHLTGWNRRLVTRLQAAQRGESEPPPHWPGQLQSEDEINAWIFAANHERSVGEVLDGSRQLFQQLFAVMEDLPEDVRIEFVEPKFHIVWVGDKYFPVGEFFYHFHDDHEPDVRAWLARQEKP
jgi:hypothetical protein